MSKLEFDFSACTIEQAIRKGAEYLQSYPLSYGHGTSNPLDESAWLIIEAAGLSPVDAPDYEQLFDTASQQRASEYFSQRCFGLIPTAYITKRCWFAGLEFYVDERTLIPRSPLAEPILEAFSTWLEPQNVHSVLDLCTGGGCIAIACAYAFPDAQVDAVDLSEEALEVAAINVKKHHVQQQLSLYSGDLYTPLVEGKRYDLIVSNPPYVDASDMSELTAEFKHEPKMGLAAGDDGLSIVHTILSEASSRLTDDGLLVCEVGNSAEALEKAYPELPFTWIDFDYGGVGVFVLSRIDLLQLNYRSR